MHIYKFTHIASDRSYIGQIISGLMYFCRVNNLSYDCIRNSQKGWNVIKLGKVKELTV